MRKVVLGAVSALFSFMVAAQPIPTQTLKLYPEGQNVDKGIALGPGESNGFEGGWTEYQYRQYTHIADPFINIYIPEKCNGQMVVILPGGGYTNVCANHEGQQVADWMNQRGIAACVVIYRTPNGHDTIPLTDVQNTFRYLRANAAKWGVKQIGVLGFSAGGHLAASASTLFVDDVTRPDFSVLFYPVISSEPFGHFGSFKNLILGEKINFSNNSYKAFMSVANDRQKELLKKYSLEKQVTDRTPKAILFLSQDDTGVPPMNSISYFNELNKRKIEAELHIFPNGKHGWGFGGRNGKPDGLSPELRKDLFQILDRWLKARAAEIPAE